MKIRMIPTILMLIAGAITSIICYILNYEVRIMLILLLVAMAVFYFAGDIIRFFLKKYVFPDIKKEEETEETAEGNEENMPKNAQMGDSVVKEKADV